MKDAVGGERAGEVPSNLRSGRVRMGEPPAGHTAGPTAESIGGVAGTLGTETSQYQEEEKSNEIPLVVARQRGKTPTPRAGQAPGVGRAGSAACIRPGRDAGRAAAS